MQSNILKTYKESLSGLSKEVWIISILMLVNRSGLMVIPFLAIYLTESLGFTIIQAGQAGMWFGIGSILSSFLGGILSDKYGFQNVMKFSLLTGGLAFFSLLMAKTFLVFCAFIFLTALFADLLRPAVMSSISLYSKEENRTRAISLLRMAINMGIAIGPAVGGLMIAKFGYNWLFIINGGSSILTFFLVIIIFKFMKTRSPIVSDSSEEMNNDAGKWAAYKDFNYWYMLFIMFLMTIAFLQIIFAVPLFFKQVYCLSEQEVGIFFTINGLMIVIFEMPIVHFYEKKRMFKKPIVIGGILMALSFISLLIPVDYSPSFWMLPFMLYTLLIGFGEICNLPFFNSLSLARSNSKNSGSYMGLFALNFSLAFTFMPIFGSQIISHYSYNVLWISCAGLVLLSVALFLWSKKRFLITEKYK